MIYNIIGVKEAMILSIVSLESYDNTIKIKTELSITTKWLLHIHFKKISRKFILPILFLIPIVSLSHSCKN